MTKDLSLQKTPFVSIRKLGMGGLVTKGDPQDLDDIQSPDMKNITLDGGIVGPRFGTSLFLAAPTGETAVPSQLLKATDSNGNTYLVGVWGVNFYLLDQKTPQWIKLNNAYSPTKIGLYYGSADWNKGLGSDAFYLCNGVDSMMKWNQSLAYLGVAALAGDSTLTLKDSSTLPASGTLVVIDNTGAPFTLAFTGNVVSTGVLTITGTVGRALNIGNAVTMVMLQMAGMPIGKVIRVSTVQAAPRLFVANGFQHESTLNFSKADTPEDFGILSDPSTGGSSVITKGEGGILDLIDFGLFFVVIKQNSFTQYYFYIDITNNSLVVEASPIEYGESILPIGARASIIAENDYYYPTKSQGIYQFVPGSTGTSTATQNNPISDDIFQLLQGVVDFSQGSSAFYRRQLIWTCSTIPGVNNILLIRDLVWNAWTIWDNINAVDLQEINDVLYMLSLDDGGLYFYDVTSYQDARKGQPLEFETYMFTKRFDFGKPANPKQQSLAMVQGYITPNTKLYVDVLYNEAGSLATSTYIIDGNNPVYVHQIPVYGLGRVSLGQNPIGGSQIGTIGFFRVYFDLLYRAGAHVIQMKFYTSNIGDNWGVTQIAINTEEVEKIPTELVISNL